ncbi:hypothetical protein MAPG_04553 [Magnaporthiopsis poae ATCC 64411]|uniref:chitinase n=1 Tax=Magnaporthiopsis poae (strain ATCC 64411 / 73-15) TaxID=644358 RepID=A0A0C4DX17_MAGP6|nr:hypothetical protein MAPG_04553 [Magnaporthiopsis poae ATCC 64411]
MFCLAAPALSWLLALPVLISGVQAGWNPTGKNNLVVYWGQNAGGSAKPQDLKKLCDDPAVSVVAVSFLTDFKPLKLNLASNEAGCQKMADGLLKCPQIEKDITYCQQTKKTTILLSLAGGEYKGDHIGWGSADEAKKTADKVFDLFGPVGKVPEAQRPFGKAVMNGFDFDFEFPTNNLLAFAQQLRKRADAAKLILGAAPQCPFPDKNLGPVFDGGVKFEMVAIQFYNNPSCGITSFKGQGGGKETYNFEQWATWAKTKGQNARLVVGAPASAQVGGGYVGPDKMKPIIEYSAKFPEFAGVMVWEATAGLDNGFLKAVGSSLAAVGGGAGGGKKPAPGGNKPKKPAASPAGTFNPGLAPPGLALPESQKPIGGAAAAPAPVVKSPAPHRRRSSSSARPRSRSPASPINRRRVAKSFAA